MADRYTEEELAEFNRRMLAHPFHEYCGIELLSQDAGSAICLIRVDDNTDGGGGYLHGGILYAAFDMAAFFAVMPLVERGHWVRTHAATFNLIRAARRGPPIELRARVDYAGRRTVFVRVEARIQGESEDTAPVATGSITKSIVPTSPVK